MYYQIDYPPLLAFAVIQIGECCSTATTLTDQEQKRYMITNPLRLVIVIGRMAGGSMTRKTYKFTKQLLMILSGALSLVLVLFPEMNLNEVTHV